MNGSNFAILLMSVILSVSNAWGASAGNILENAVRKSGKVGSSVPLNRVDDVLELVHSQCCSLG